MMLVRHMGATRSVVTWWGESETTSDFFGIAMGKVVIPLQSITVLHVLGCYDEHHEVERGGPWRASSGLHHALGMGAGPSMHFAPDDITQVPDGTSGSGAMLHGLKCLYIWMLMNVCRGCGVICMYGTVGSSDQRRGGRAMIGIGALNELGVFVFGYPIQRMVGLWS